MKDNLSIKDFVYNYKTTYEQGFTREEIDVVKGLFSKINIQKFDEALYGITCMMIDDQIVIYHCDIEKALRCGLQNRSLNFYEFD